MEARKPLQTDGIVAAAACEERDSRRVRHHRRDRIVLGLALFIWPGATLKIAAIALGAYFVVSGVVRIVTAIVELGLPGGWRVLDILVGLLLSVGGVVMLKNSALSGATLAVVVTMVVASAG